jgi:hypothetical protein
MARMVSIDPQFWKERLAFIHGLGAQAGEAEGAQICHETRTLLDLLDEEDD